MSEFATETGTDQNHFERNPLDRDSTLVREVLLTELGPKVKTRGLGTSSYYDNAVPVSSLTGSEQEMIEAAPIPFSDVACAPLDKATEEQYMGKLISFCDPTPPAEWDSYQMQKFQQRNQIDLGADDKVARTDGGGYIVFTPMDLY